MDDPHIKMSKNSIASTITILIVSGLAVWLDIRRTSFVPIPVATFLCVIFGPICLLLWTKHNILDYDAKALATYAFKGLGVAALLAVSKSVEYILNNSKVASPALLGILAIFAMSAGVLLVFICLSFFRLGIKRILDHVSDLHIWPLAHFQGEEVA